MTEDIQKLFQRNHGKTQHYNMVAQTFPFMGVDYATGKDETKIAVFTEEQIDSVLEAARMLGEFINQFSKEVSKAATAFGEALTAIIPVTNDPHGWHQSWERQVKKLARRERYLRRYRQRGLRMQSRKTRFHKARHKRF